MYDDLVQAQQPSALERFVLNSVLPSLFLTSLLRADVVWSTPARDDPQAQGGTVGFVMLPIVGCFPSRLVPDELPVLLTMPVPSYPALLRQAGIEGRVTLKAMVDSRGRVEPWSVGVISTTHQGLVPAARRAVLKALYRPARLRGQAITARVDISFEFAPKDGTESAR